CFADRHDADLLALGTDEANLGDPDAVVDAGFRADGTSLIDGADRKLWYRRPT
ncbi:MAG: hypothetical protein JWM76_1753, partial [Pseudonocardiales bacterium]|nr:hypothetical protein [Pseudonocardiales bacterium]